MKNKIRQILNILMKKAAFLQSQHKIEVKYNIK